MTERPTTEQIVTERGKVHGDFTDVSRVAQTFKDYARTCPTWTKMTDVQQEGLDMILHKASRILCGDPDHHDHWDDIAGYATITSKRIPPPPQAVHPKVDSDALLVFKVCSAVEVANGGFLSEPVRKAIHVVLTGKEP